MNRKTMTYLIATLVTLGLATVFVLVLAPVEAGGECSPCNGPVQSVSGRGSGNNCTEAANNAYTDAMNQAMSGAPSCTPCQLSNGPISCAMPSCYPGPCPPNSVSSTWTLNFKCESCDPGDPEIP